MNGHEYSQWSMNPPDDDWCPNCNEKITQIRRCEVCEDIFCPSCLEWKDDVMTCVICLEKWYNETKMEAMAEDLIHNHKEK
ncbi:MAG: hypothetical protein AABY22_14630 [Nanoarchaeota archaeon]